MAALGEFEQLVMVAVVRLKDGAYGVPIQREVEERAGRRVTVGALYATLDRLEGKRLLESWFADPTPQRGGKSKRYFLLTAEGEAALVEAKAAHERMWRGVRLKGGSRA
jgi:DNA-binding PadR family transcriptional regulator